LHPNPQQAGHRLSAHNPTSGPARYTLYSAQGQQLSQHQVAPGQSLSLRLSSPGLYSVRIETVTGTYWQKLSVY
ncbi:MAG: T9SS type A sorting domain-containing protein, partial [Bacteroidetes bacterium]|nr:T9SS type A sorting domain-containing protein [Bacteroidota bacterium]